MDVFWLYYGYLEYVYFVYIQNYKDCLDIKVYLMI